MPSAFPQEGRQERRRAWQEAYARAGAERERLTRALAQDFAPLRRAQERLDLDLDDEATRLLMQHLYDGMLPEKDPLSPAEALREAALKVRGSTGTGGRWFAHPLYWAAFVCHGK